MRDGKTARLSGQPAPGQPLSRTKPIRAKATIQPQRGNAPSIWISTEIFLKSSHLLPKNPCRYPRSGYPHVQPAPPLGDPTGCPVHQSDVLLPSFFPVLSPNPALQPFPSSVYPDSCHRPHPQHPQPAPPPRCRRRSIRPPRLTPDATTRPACCHPTANISFNVPCESSCCPLGTCR